MARRSYKFTDKKHTKQGLLSVACGGTALILTASVVGFVLALRGFQEEDVYVISSQIGVVVDGLLFILWAMVCVIGM